MEKIDTMEENEVLQIINYLNNPTLSEDEIINALKGFGETEDKNAIPFLMGELKKFDKLSWGKRNAIAISLGRLGANEAVPFIMEIVMNEKFKSYNGSFLYALTLKPLNCKEYFLDFVELLCNGDLEIRESADTLIEKFYTQINKTTKKEALKILYGYKVLIEASPKAKEKYDAIGYIENAIDLLEKEET